LLLYNHERMIGGVRNFKAAMEGRKFEEGVGDGEGPEAGKDYLLSLMFSHFDKNNNGALEYEELHRVRVFGLCLHISSPPPSYSTLLVKNANFSL
jgi:hypothetical protein